MVGAAAVTTHDNPHDNPSDILNPLRKQGMTTCDDRFAPHNSMRARDGMCVNLDVIGCHVVTTPTATAENGVTTGMTTHDDLSDPAARLAHAARWREDEARRIAIMGEHAGTPEGIRRLVAAGELSAQAGATLLACFRT